MIRDGVGCNLPGGERDGEFAMFFFFFSTVVTELN